MLRRWIIRSLALALLTLCLTAWVGSYWRGADLVLVRADSGWEEWFSICGGKIGLGLIPSSAVEEIGWHLSFWSVAELHWAVVVRELHYGLTTYHSVGFGFQPGEHWQVHIPLWFPTLLSAFFLWLLWRKTKSQPKALGFPIEPTATLPSALGTPKDPSNSSPT